MQTKDIIRQPLTTEWAIVDPFSHVHKSYRNVNDLPEHSTIIGKLVSYNTYRASNHSHTDANHPSFIPDSTDKTKRFLVKYQDNAGTDIYRIFEAKDIIATKSEVEAGWAVKRVQQAEANARKQREQAEHDRLRQQAEASEQAVQQAVDENILALFGPVAKESIQAYWIRSNIKLTTLPDGQVKGKIEMSGEVRIPVEEFLRLAERLANA